MDDDDFAPAAVDQTSRLQTALGQAVYALVEEEQAEGMTASKEFVHHLKSVTWDCECPASPARSSIESVFEPVNIIAPQG